MRRVANAPQITMLSSVNPETMNGKVSGGFNDGEYELFKTLGPLLVAAVAESHEEGCEEVSPSMQALLDYLTRSSLEQISFLAKDPQFQHYLRRLVCSETEHARDMNVAKLLEFFPDEVSRFQKVQLPYNYNYKKPKEQGTTHGETFRMENKKPAHKRSATEGDMDMLFRYHPSKLPVTFKGPDVKLSDLPSAAQSVDMEIRRSLRYDSAFLLSRRRKKAVRTVSENTEKPLLQPVYGSDLKDSDLTLFPREKPPRKSLKTPPVYIHGHPIHTAQDVIEAFASRKLRAESEFVYLNYANPDKRLPYDLTVVPKTKVDPEYFVISKFGIICVVPNEASDIQTFSEWLREASMFMLLRQISLFKDYKIRKALQQWHRAIKLIKFWRLRTKICGMAVRYLPAYADALVKVRKLSDELLVVPFHEFEPHGQYTLETLHRSFRKTQSMGRRFLSKYFRYCRRAVCEAIESVHSEVLRMEVEHHHQPFVSDLPISIQQRNHKILKKELEAALERRSKLGIFVELAEQIVCSCILQVTQQAMSSWRNLLVRKESILHKGSSGFQIPLRLPMVEDEGDEEEGPVDKHFVRSIFEFDESGNVSLKPSSQDFRDLIASHYSTVLNLVSSAASPLDRPVSKEHGKDRNHPNEDDSPAIEGEVAAQKRKHLSLPPSLCPSKHPVKSLQRALRGIPQADVAQFFSGADGMLTSQAARTRMNMAGTEKIVPTENNTLMRHSPLNKVHFLDILENDKDSKVISEDILVISDKVFRNLESLLQDHSWLTEVWNFLQTWKGFDHNDIFKIDLVQEILQHLHGWYNQLLSLPPHYLGPYGVVCVSTSEIVNLVVPKLLSIQKQVETEVINKARTLCVMILKKIKAISEILSSKRYDLEGFSEYAHTLMESTKFWSDESSSVVYVKQMHGTLNQLRVLLVQADKDLAKELQSEWQYFQGILADAKDFVTRQTPIKAQGLQQSISTCEEEILALVEQVNGGVFIDPHQPPYEVLQELASIREKVSTVHARLLGLCKWKDDITGFPHNLSPTQDLVDQFYYRQELWKYRRTFDRNETEWKLSSFKTLDIESISEKIVEWLEISKELGKVVRKEDPVLSEWNKRLISLQKGIPLLLQLASKNLKLSHWITIFAALGEDYIPAKQYTLNDFSLYHIYDHSSIVFEICHDAMQLENLKNLITNMTATLEEQVLTVTLTYTEFSPLAFKKQVQTPKASSAKETKAVNAPAKKTGTDKITSFALDVIQSEEDDNESRKIHRVSNFLEVIINLEHHLTQLKMFLASPHLGSLRAKAESLLGSVLQLLEIVALLSDCQTKWDKLLRLFDSIAPATRSSSGLKQLQKVTIEYQLIAKSIYNDPRLLSLLDKKHGQKGFRECQGEVLRKTCNIILKSLDSVETTMENVIGEASKEFPRLYFLSSKDVLTAICNQGDPLPMVPIINKVFPAIKMARFSSKAASSKTLGSDSEDFQIISVLSWFDETLTLSAPLPLGKKSGVQWLSALEKAMSYSLSSYLNEAYLNLPDLLKGATPNDEKAVNDLASWLDTHLNQCVLIAMELHWTQAIYQALASLQPALQLKQNSLKLGSAAQCITEVLVKRRSLWSSPTDLLLQHLILLLNRQSALIQMLLSDRFCGLNSFNWKFQLHYSTDVAEKLYTVSNIELGDKVRLSSSAKVQGRSIKRSSSTTFAMQTNSLTSSKVNVSDVNIGSAKTTISKMAASFSNRANLYDPLRALVHCNNTTVPYGFEFLHANDHLGLNPQTEAALFSMIQAMKSNSYSLISSSSKPSVTGKDLAISLGAPFHAIDCSMLTKASILYGLFRCSVSSGTILQLNSFHQLPLLLQVSLGEWLSKLSGRLYSSLCGNDKKNRLHLLSATSQRSTSIELSSPTCPLNPISEVGQYSPKRIRSREGLEAMSPTKSSTSQLDWYDEQTSVLEFSDSDSHRFVKIEGSLLKVSPLFACILVGDVDAQPIPQQLKSSLRSVNVPLPNLNYLAESLLTSNGFYEAHTLGQLLVDFQHELKCQLLSCNPVMSSSLGGSSLKRIISHAASLLENDTGHSEQAPLQENEAIVQSIIHVLGSQLSHPKANDDEEEEEEEEEENEEQQDIKGNTYLDLAGWTKLMNLLDLNFSSDVLHSSFPADLSSAIKTQLKERHLQYLPEIVEKIEQLHLSLATSNCVFLAGPCGSGKTTCYSILNAAYEYIRRVAKMTQPSFRENMEQKQTKYPFISISVINPKAYSLDELLGYYDGEIEVEGKCHSAWKTGVLPAAIKKIENYNNAVLMYLHPDCNQPSHCLTMERVTHWLVLDGPLDPILSQALSHLMEEGLTLKNGETIALPRTCKLIVETQTLDHATPSLLCTSILYCSRETVSYKALVNTWLDKAPTQHNLSSTCTETLAIMINQLLPETLTYLTAINSQHYGADYKMWRSSQVYGLIETQCFLRFLSAVLERNAPKEEMAAWSRSNTSRSSRANSQAGSRCNSMVFTQSMVSFQTDYDTQSKENLLEDDLPPNDNFATLDTDYTLSARVQLATMLAFAYIWSLGAFVPFSEMQSFSDLARSLIMTLPYNVPVPEEGIVFDYCLDLKQYRFIPWEESKARGVRNMGGGYFALPELTRFSYLADLYLSYGYNILLVGEQGTGKTAFIDKMMKKYITLTNIPITPTLSPSKLRAEIISASVQQTKQPGYRIALLRKSVAVRTGLCFGDLHLAGGDGQSFLNICHPVLEVIQHLVSHYMIADSSRNWSEKHLNIKYLASCTPEGYWNIPAKITSKMCVLPFLPPSNECLQQVLSHSLQLWLASSSILTNTKQIAQALSAASVTVFRSVAQRLQPSASHPHYHIDMHDLIRVYEGLLLVSPDTKSQTQPIFSLLSRRGFRSSTYGTSRSRTSIKLKRGSRQLPSLKGAAKKAEESNMKVDSEEVVATLRMIIRAWCHESTRVYLDRSTESRDHLWFLKLLEACIKHCFCGVEFGTNVIPKDPFSSRRAIGNTAGGRNVRGTRASKGATGSGVGNARAQGSLPMDGLNEEELSSTGIRVDILKALMKTSHQSEKNMAEEDSELTDLSPPKLISLDQVTMRGEDLTGLIFAQFPDPCTPVSTPEPEKTSDKSSDSSSEESNLDLVQPKATTKEHPLARPYSELGDGQVTEILSKHLEHFQMASMTSGMISQKSCDDIVLYKEAMEHCARLYRVVNLPGAHALLLGLPGSGKRSLIRLMAYIMQSNLMDVDSSCVKVTLRSCLREACISASLDNCSTIVILSDRCPISIMEWDQIIHLMNSGNVSGLFSSSEITVIGNKLETGKMKRNTAEAAAQSFRQAIQTNLHVIVVWSVDSVTGSLFAGGSGATEGVHHLDHETAVRNLFRTLHKSCAYIDYYKPWSKSVYSDIAIMWWQRVSSAVRWQDWADSSSQLEAIGGLAAHIHITTSDKLSQVYGSYSRMMVSPRILMECLTLAQHIAVNIKAKERMKVSKLQSALQKLHDVDKTLFEHECKLTKLKSRLTAAEEDVHRKMGLITTAKERYMEANKRCKEAEQVIEFETTNVQKLAVQVHENFDEISKTYSSALESLSCVNQNDIFELMSYRKPPEVLHPIFNALCMIFDREENWDECKVLLMSHKFIDNLKFFDRDNLSRQKLRKLEKSVYKTVDAKTLEAGSKAILPIHKWLNALVDYHVIMETLDPLKKKLKDAEDTLAEANVVFVTMKRDMMLAKTALENAVKQHKESVKKARAVESDIEALKNKIEKVNHILSTMSRQRKMWEERLGQCQSYLDSIPGHAMLCAAGVYYLARTPPALHKELLANWLGYCSGAVSLGCVTQDSSKLQAAQSYGAYSGQRCVVMVQKDFSLAYHFSDEKERYLWQQESSFPDDTILDRSLCARIFNQCMSPTWPLIFDPYRQFESYLRALNMQQRNTLEDEGDDVFHTQSDRLLLVDSSSNKLIEVLERAVAERKVVLLCIDIDHVSLRGDINNATRKKKVLTKILQKRKNSATAKYSNTVVQGFQLYLVVHRTVRELLTPRGSTLLTSALRDLGITKILDGNLVDMELIREALECHLLRLVTSHDRPEYQIRHKSFITDLILHKQKLDEKEEEMLNATLDPKHQSLLSADELLGVLKEKEEFEVSALDQIKETNKNLEQFDKQLKMYQPLTKFASAVLCSLQRLSSVFQYFSFRIDEFEEILAKIIINFKTSRPANNPMSVNAHVLHLKNCLMLSVYKHFQVRVFEKHQLLIPLLIELVLETEQGKVDDKEVGILCRSLGGLAAQLECEEMGSKNVTLYRKPDWVTDRSWCMALELQKDIPDLRRLMADVASSSNEWEEYFKLASSTMASIPGFGDRCSFSQKLLLWKCFSPEKFHVLAKDGILAMVGADFIDTKSPTLEEMLKLTKPTVVTLLFLPQFPAEFPSVKTIREEASRLKVDVKHFTLDTPEKCKGVINKLAAYASESCWVVIEYCHLMSNYPDILDSMNEKIAGAEVHSKFRALVLVPVGHLSKHSSINKCHKLVFQTPAEPDVSELSRSLLKDLSRFVASSNGNQKVLSTARFGSVLSKFQAFLPKPITDFELKALDPQQQYQDGSTQDVAREQELLFLIYEELWVHNQAVVKMHASLIPLLSFLRGRALFSKMLGKVLNCVCKNKIPHQWESFLPKPLGQIQGLVSAVKLLKAQLDMYTSILRSGSVPNSVHPLLFSNPAEVFSRLASCYATRFQVERNTVVIKAEIIETNSSEVDDYSLHLLSENAPLSCILHSLALHNASWHHTHKCLVASQETQQNHSFKCSIMVYPTTRQDSITGYDLNLHNFPVLLDSKNSKPQRVTHNQTGPVLFHIPLPRTFQEAEQKTDVHFTCDINMSTINN